MSYQEPSVSILLITFGFILVLKDGSVCAVYSGVPSAVVFAED